MLTAFVTELKAGSRVAKLGALVETCVDGVVVRVDDLVWEDAAATWFSVTMIIR